MQNNKKKHKPLHLIPKKPEEEEEQKQMHAIRLLKFDGKERREGEAEFGKGKGEERVFVFLERRERNLFCSERKWGEK